MKSNKIWFAHMLRGIAALCVVYAHLFVCRLPAIGNNDIKDPFISAYPVSKNIFEYVYDALWQNFYINLGAVGVGIFFIISGFVISFSISKRSRIRFILNRVFRIYPVVIVALLIDFIFLYIYRVFVQGGGEMPLVEDYVINASLLIRPLVGVPLVNGVLWTLEIEFIFYIIIFFIGANAIRSRWCSIYISLLMVSLYFFSFKLDSGNFALFIRNFSPHILMMFVGVYFFNLYKRTFVLGNVADLMSLVVPFCLSVYLHFRNFPNNLELVVSYSILPFVIWSVAYMLRDSMKPIGIFNFFANISFSMYLCHQIFGFLVLGILLRLNINLYVVILCVVVIAILYSYLVYKFVESFAQNLSKKF